MFFQFYILKIAFKKTNMFPKLEYFINNTTKKYDKDKISYIEYIIQLDLLLNYINIKTNTDITSNTLNAYIEQNKYHIYAKSLKSKLKINSNTSKKETISRYINYFGKKSYNKINITTLSLILNKNIKETTNIVHKHYCEIEKKLKIEKLEKDLFNITNTQFYSIKYIDSLNGFEFEDYLKKLFESFEYDVKRTSYSNDFGADLIMSKGIKKIVIQAKNYNYQNNKVGVKAIQEVVSAKTYYDCDIAIVITNSYFTKNATKMAKKAKVILIDRGKLINILKEGGLYFNSIIT